MMGQVRETLPVCEKANNKYKSDLPIFRSVVNIKLQKCTIQDDIFNCTKSVGQIVCSVRFETSNSALLQWQESIKIAAENRQQKYVSGGYCNDLLCFPLRRTFSTNINIICCILERLLPISNIRN